ncbi:WhiB family transcriptional regulator [Streptomyces sp. UNOC14_S4]|uniref:WhiB family transcriptional regulator n=1 Tax=Streptomyces sp. UNOC14_S4 TaxID=2872340 RepID=UPI001E554F00|nr:WhiB family transcriptional regulator [Streptomyces sp. UNOC14_S4]MCC3766019.1 WhiB family transcriptional regulator [Streptomyces sp. UNOC14_S4]
MALYSRKKAPDWSANGNPALEAKCRKPRTPDTATSDPWFDDPDEARAICNGTADGIICPMRHECLTQAMINNERHGVWAGLTEIQLVWMRRHFRHQPDQWHVENAIAHEELVQHEAHTEDTRGTAQEDTGPRQLELPFRVTSDGQVLLV